MTTKNQAIAHLMGPAMQAAADAVRAIQPFSIREDSFHIAPGTALHPVVHREPNLITLNGAAANIRLQPPATRGGGRDGGVEAGDARVALRTIFISLSALLDTQNKSRTDDEIPDQAIPSGHLQGGLPPRQGSPPTPPQGLRVQEPLGLLGDPYSDDTIELLTRDDWVVVDDQDGIRPISLQDILANYLPAEAPTNCLNCGNPTGYEGIAALPLSQERQPVLPVSQPTSLNK